MVVDGVTDPTTLEALACREALALATDLLLSHVEVASDCKGVVSDIQNYTGGLHGNIIREIKDTMSEFESCTFIFEGRMSSIEAHSLAIHSLSLSVGRHIWLLQLPDINCIPMQLIVD